MKDLLKKRKKPIKEIPSSLLYAMVANGSRALKLFLLISLSLNVILAYSIAVLIPLKTIETRYVEFSTTENQLVAVHSAKEFLKSNGDLIKNATAVALRDYVKARETKTAMEATQILLNNKVDAMTSRNEFSQYKKIFWDRDKAMEKQTRTIRIISDNSIPAYKGIPHHQIEYETIDTSSNGEVINFYKATIAYNYETLITNEKTRLLNPLNIIVKDYKVAKQEK